MEIFTIIPYCDGQNLVVEKAIYEFNQKLLLEMIHFGNDILSLKTKDKEELKIILCNSNMYINFPRFTFHKIPQSFSNYQSLKASEVHNCGNIKNTWKITDKPYPLWGNKDCA